VQRTIADDVIRVREALKEKGDDFLEILKLNVYTAEEGRR
jgi:hypothetical protein